ncbi:MAG: biotin/lipoyl-binding carrier protein [Hyphomicrobiaceae bacterium]|nr:biotin/lipoyl-binding carrier protein [Hyphomicrobiaceae bacterium]
MAKIKIASEITGAVWKITTQVGQSIAAGEPLMILESMKMEIPVVSEDGGTVREILVKEGDAVQEGQIVAIVEG